jgi:hypothetical protein
MTYCDFKPGDEVVCVDAGPRGTRAHIYLDEGQTYVVEGFDGFTRNGKARLFLVGVCSHHPPERRASFAFDRFRKVQPRDLSAWLSTTTDFEEPKRAPAKERERV